MAEAILIPISFFIAVFAIMYLYYTTRNKERLALIEKGADASIFFSRKGRTPTWKIILMNVALLLMSIGLAIFIAAFISEIGLDEDIAYPGTIFLMAGIGLFVGFTMTKKLDKEE